MQPYHHVINRPAAGQHGAALIIGLVLLISLTVVGVSLLSTTSLEQRMAGNMADMNLAFNSAETATRAFSAFVRDGNHENVEAVCQGFASCYPFEGRLEANWWDKVDKNWWENNAQVLDSRLLADRVLGVKNQPRLAVQVMKRVSYSLVRGHEQKSDTIAYIAVTSRGTGSSDDTDVIVEQMITKRD